MTTRRPLTTLSTGKRGRPPSVRKRVRALIGAGNLHALETAGFIVVPRPAIAELSLFLGEPMSNDDPALPQPPPQP